MLEIILRIALLIFCIICLYLVDINLQYKRKFEYLIKLSKNKNPTETDLELATLSQLIFELSKRRSFILLSSKIDKNSSEEGLIEIHSNMPLDIVPNILQTAILGIINSNTHYKNLDE